MRDGGDAAATPQEVAERTDVVITMLPDSPDVEQVYLGEDGVIAGTSAGMLLIDMSSIAPAVARAVFDAASEAGAAALDAPGLGRRRRRARRDAVDHGRGAPGRVRAGAPAVRRARQDDRAARRGRDRSDREGLQPDPRRGHDRGRQRGARARVQGRRRPRAADRGAVRRARRQPRDGGQAPQLPRARLHAGVQARAPPQGSRDRPADRARARRVRPRRPRSSIRCCRRSRPPATAVSITRRC